MAVYNADWCRMWSARPVTELTVVILAPTPRHTAASERAAMRQARHDRCESQVSADDGRRCGQSVGGAISELSVIITTPAKRPAIGRDETAMHAARDDADP
jgi:hypothetical protein